MAEALYNKYRPQIFEDVVGQEHIERTLKNAIANDKISHAYMFTGPRGTGKTTTARLLAKALLCGEGPTPDPDGTCEDCELIASGEHPDVYELDAASRTGVENVREEIIGKVNYAPTRGRYKVYIIDEVHMLSTAAFNALLKTLEEPPSHVVFVLCTTDPQKVPETIQSRCQRFDFRRISSEELISRLGAICEMEGIQFEGDALDLIAHRANGGMRDALTSLDQLIAFGDGSVTREVAERLLGAIDSSELGEIVHAIGARDIAAAFRWTAEYMETGADLVQIVGELTSHMRDMYVMSLTGADVALEVTETGRRELEVELPLFGSDRLARTLIVLGDLATDLKTSTNQRLSFEIALTRLVRPEGDLTLEALAERIEALERGGVTVDAAAASVIPAAAAEAQVTTSASHAASSNAAASSSDQLSARDTKATEAVSTPQATSPSQVASDPRTMPASSGAAEARAYNDGAAVSDAQPASSPAQALTPTSPIDLSSRNLNQLWETVLAHLKKIGPAYGVVFLNTVIELVGDELKISFPADSEFAFKASQKADARTALEKAFERAGVGGVKYQIVKSDVSKADMPHAAAQTNVEEATPSADNAVDSMTDVAVTDAAAGCAADNAVTDAVVTNAAVADAAVSTAAVGAGGIDGGDGVTSAREGASGDASSLPKGDGAETQALPTAQDNMPPWDESDVVTQGDAVREASIDDVTQSSSAPNVAQQPPEEDLDFSDFITAAFGDVVIEEVRDDAE